DPLERSASNQFQRLVTGKVAVEDFDLGALRFDLGAPGLRYLERLEKAEGETAALTDDARALLQARISDLRSVNTRWEWDNLLRDNQLAEQTRQIEWVNLPADGTPPLDALLE